MRKRQVLIIGLDGGTWRVLDPMMEFGVMPYLKFLVQNSASGILESTIPPVTAPAWASFLTGVYPQKHGIFDFSNYEPKNYSTYFVNATHLEYRTLWDILSTYGKKIISINVPLTFPPQPVNGLVVSGMLAPNTENFTYPPELKEEIFTAVNGYKIITTGRDYFLHGLNKFVDELINTEKKRINLAEYLLQKYDWDVAMVHIQSTDIIQHYLYHVLDKKHALHDRRGLDKVCEFYKEVDRGINRLLNLGTSDSLKILMSDHGFRPVTKTVSLNNFLSEKGFLNFRKDKAFTLFVAKALSKLSDYDRLNVGRWLFGKMRRKVGERIAANMIDFPRTTAFSINGWAYGNIYINLEGREGHGIVETKNYKHVRSTIVNEVERIRDADTGEKMFEVYKKKDWLKASFQSGAADIVIMPKGPYEFATRIYPVQESFMRYNKARRDHTGGHDRNGIVLFTGSSLNKQSFRARIVDLMPTILWYVGLPVPDYADGDVLTEIFKNNFVKSFPVNKIPIDKKPGSRMKHKDSDVIEDRLRALGYL